VSDAPAAGPIFLVGCTGTGKSRLAHEVALELEDVEIATVDSMTVYREMDIGTAKPSRADRGEVRYHLLDLVDPAEEFDVAQFQSAARAAAADVRGSGRTLLHVGGTGLYGRSIIDDLQIPPRYPDIHQRLVERAATDPSSLWRELCELDPDGAARMEPTNSRRVLRALEVTIGSGSPFSSFGPGLRSYPRTRTVQVGLRVDAGWLDAKVEGRFLAWLDEGLLEEVGRLAERPAGLSRTARQAVGYRQLLEHVEGDASLDEAVSAAISATRRLARRQRSWFERDPRVEWYDESAQARDRLRSLLAERREAMGD
jgi:tRNA dimethylallyltransferase